MNEIEYFEVRSNKNILRGLVHIGSLNIPVLIVHGYFSSNKIGPYRLYYQIANELNSLGYSVFRIDLSSMGESDGDSDNVLFHQHVTDLSNVINYIKKRCKVDKIHVVAHCIGCCTAIKCAISSDVVDTLTLLSPFIPNKDNYHALIGEQAYKQVAAEGYFFRKTMKCTKSYIEAGSIVNRVGELSVHNDVYVYISENDEFCSLDDSLSWARRFGIPYEIIENASHNYLEYESRKRILNRLKKRFDLIKD